jgi:molybdenum cofactor cytidylyltransferase
MILRTALRIEPGEVVAFVGAGGKTTAMFRLARELAQTRGKVITTTTAKIGEPSREQTPAFIVDDDRAELLERLQRALISERHVSVAAAPYADGKFRGVPADWIGDLKDLPDVFAVLVEADGARKLPFKAPRAAEPVIPSSTTLLVVVAGMEAVGAPLDEEHVCRAAEVSALLNVPMGTPLSTAAIAHVMSHPEGGLKSRPAGARVIALLNQADDPRRLEAAREVASNLHAGGSFDEILIAGLAHHDPVIERWGRTTAIIMAAGEGRRFGSIKQLARWGNTTLIQHVIDLVQCSRVDEVQVVLGAHAEFIRPLLDPLSAHTHVVTNENWAAGMSTSLIAGLAQTRINPSAAVFINVDQPGIRLDLIDRLIDRHRKTGAAIIAPRYQNMRGNPVLWDRTLFAELQTLSGDVGGREILRQHWRDIVWVELDSEEELTDTDTPEEYQRLKEILDA